MANEAHVQIVKSLYAAFLSGDTDAMLRCLADEVVCTMPEMPGVSLRARYEGKQGFKEFLAERAPFIQYTMFEPHRFFSDQENVIVLGETAGVVIRNRGPFRYKWVQLFEFTPDNRIKWFHEFLDTQVLVTAFASPVA
jgi:ketosteroid isomerase-like protein